jgi:hypothetical protein
VQPRAKPKPETWRVSMICANDVKINDLENYVKYLFDLEKKLIDKDGKIAMLEFELAMEKQLRKVLSSYVK